MTELFNAVKAIIVDRLGVAESEVVAEASFKEDLNADSLDVVEMVMAIEDEFGIEIPDEAAEKITTVGQVVAFLESAKANA